MIRPFLIAATLAVSFIWTGAARAQANESGLGRLNFMIGEWRGTSSGEPGEGKVERTCSYSYDKSSKKLRLRQFHGEGFVNTYAEAESLSFVTVEIENIPAGWRARETYEHSSADAWSERFELAEPGQDFKLYSASTLQRVK